MRLTLSKLFLAVTMLAFAVAGLVSRPNCILALAYQPNPG